MTAASESRRRRKARAKDTKAKERSLTKLRKRKGDDAATDRVLAEQAQRWAERQKPGLKGVVVECACGSEFMALVGTDGTPLVKQCNACRETK